MKYDKCILYSSWYKLRSIIINFVPDSNCFDIRNLEKIVSNSIFLSLNVILSSDFRIIEQFSVENSFFDVFEVSFLC